MLRDTHLLRLHFCAQCVSRGVITQNEFDSILESMPTVASNTAECIARAVSGSMPLSEFIETYGHLRPGTYDITIPSYGEDPEKYLGHHLGAGNSGTRDYS